jgi:hypothetical protein
MAFFSSFMMSMLVSSFPASNETVQGVIWVVGTMVIFMVAWAYRAKYADESENIYLVNRRDAVAIVTDVLDDKQLPYQKIWNGKGYNFHIHDAHDLVVEVEDADKSRYSSEAYVSSISRLRLKSVNKNNELLAKSLRYKFNEAFAPVGLQRNRTRNNNIDITLQ